MEQALDNIIEQAFPENPSANLESLNSLKMRAIEETEGENGFMDPKPPKKERGRPKGSKNKKLKEEEKKAEEVQTENLNTGAVDPELKKMSAMMVNALSSKLVQITTVEKAALLPEEKESLSVGLAMLGQKYLPTITGAYALEISVAYTVLMIGIRVKSECDAELDRRLAVKARMDAQAESTKRSGTEMVVMPPVMPEPESMQVTQ